MSKTDAVGIIAEFNPLHLGHKYLIDCAAQKGDCVVAVISGNFVQRGDVALISKQARAQMALSSGADLCIELPVAWSMSTAQNFALGGISLLKNLGCVKTVAFGSECGDIELLKQISAAIHSDHFKVHLDAALSNGKTFAAARQEAVEAILGKNAQLLSGANNTLAAEYISAAAALGWSPQMFTVKRLGAEHDGKAPQENTASGEFIRCAVKEGNIENALDYMSSECYGILKQEYDNQRIADIFNIETAIIAGLRLQNRKFFANLPDLSEGIENRLFSFVKSATTLPELYNLVKTRRYTMARIRRTVLSAFLQIDNSFFGKEPPYIRVLGFTSKGEELLKCAAKTAKVPIINRTKDLTELSGFAGEVFGCECKATDIFALSTASPLPCGMEYTQKIIKV